MSKIILILENGERSSIASYNEAVSFAEIQKLTLKKINSVNDIDVYKLVDTDKLRFQEAKRLKQQRENYKKNKIKEVRFSLSIQENDKLVKLRHVLSFLESGNKVKLALRLKGREISAQNFLRAKTQLDNIINSISNVTQKQVTLSSYSENNNELCIFVQLNNHK